ncbi:class I lanthipeptide [Kordia sp.]|uniref:class I lanthipeptide n=1 Tax=Kordia sp. TaxID=1965332 RepID=UPI003B5BA05B
MKKKSIKKLQLYKASISTLNANALSGGTAQSAYDFCETINICETRDYTACNGEFGCQLYFTINC